MKLCDLMSVFENSLVFINANPCESNDFNSRRLCKVECYESCSGKEFDYFPDKSSYCSIKDFTVVAVSYGLQALMIFVEESSHGKV